MTAGLTINGLTVPAKEGTYNETPRDIGEQTIALDGSQRRTRIASKRDCSFDTYALPVATSLAWELLLRGFGETFEFNSSLYGSKGTGPTLVGSVVASATYAKFGAKSMKVPTGAGPANTAQFVFATPTASTVCCWQKYDNSDPWQHFVVTSTGKKWVDGSRNDAASTTWLTLSSGTVTFTGTITSEDMFVDDFVWLPFEVPTDWPPVWGVASSAFSLLPFLTLAGQAVGEASTRSVIGNVSASPKFYANSTGSLGLHQELSVELIGV